MTIESQGIRWGGYSVGGFATCIDLPGYKVCVDVGRLVESTIARETVLVTHGHADHVGAFSQHVAQRGLRRAGPATYLVPPGLGDDLEAMMAVWRGMDGGELRCDIVEWAPGTPRVLRPDLVVTPFETVHRVPSQGYLFESVRKRLSARFDGAAREDVIAAKARGESVEEEVREARLAISGDTTIDGVLGRPEVLGADVLMLECTFLDERVSPAQAREMGHVHLEDVAEHAAVFECEELVLYHVSPRHSFAAARRLVQQTLPAELAARTRVWVGDAAATDEGS